MIEGRIPVANYKEAQLWNENYKKLKKQIKKVSDQNRPLLLVEGEWGEKSIAPSVVYFKEKLSVPLAIQVSGTPGVLRQYQRGVT